MIYKLERLKTAMTERQALDFMQRARDEAIATGCKVVRIIRDGKVQEQFIGEPHAKIQTE